jgi:hypothetical protein
MGNEMSSRGLIRSRWAAIGAAVAVTLGGGGLIGVSAASGDASSLKTVTPTRIMDTRQGSDGKVSGETVALQVTGEVTTYASDGTTPAATVVPAGANAVSLNLTVTQGERNQGYGFVTAFPCTAVTDTVPNASTLNFVEGVDVANSTVVPLGSTGKICLNVYGSAHLIIDANGYYETADAYTKAESDAVFAKADDLEETIASVAWPVMTMQHSTIGLTMRGDLNCDNTENMVQMSNIGAVIYTDINPQEQDCYSVLPLSALSSAGGIRWMPSEVVVCVDISVGSEINSIMMTGVNPGGVAGVEFLLSFSDNPIVEDGCYQYSLEWDSEDSPWGFAAYQLQFGTSWTQNGGQIHLESVEVTSVYQDAGDAAPFGGGDQAGVTGDDGWEIPFSGLVLVISGRAPPWKRRPERKSPPFWAGSFA